MQGWAAEARIKSTGGEARRGDPATSLNSSEAAASYIFSDTRHSVSRPTGQAPRPTRRDQEGEREKKNLSARRREWICHGQAHRYKRPIQRTEPRPYAKTRWRRARPLGEGAVSVPIG